MNDNGNNTKAIDFLGKNVDVVIDRPMGSKHPKHNFEYPINYGYIPNTKSPDGEELDVYVLGATVPLAKCSGKVIAMIHRIDDNDDKLIVSTTGNDYSDDEINEAVKFQEQWFKSKIVR